jgi:hypothetical protein
MGGGSSKFRLSSRGAQVWDRGRSIVGSVDADGTVWDQGRSIVGSVDADGTVWDQGRSIVGSVDPAPRTRRGGAALLLLL